MLNNLLKERIIMEIGLEIQMLLTVSFLISGLSKIVSFEDFLNTLSYFFKKNLCLKSLAI